MRWKTLDEHRKIKCTSSGFYIVVPKKKSKTIPIACPVCDCFLNGNIDLNAYHRNECCNFCETEYAYLSSAKWLLGWRPDKKIVVADLKMRKIAHSSIIF